MWSNLMALGQVEGSPSYQFWPVHGTFLCRTPTCPTLTEGIL